MKIAITGCNGSVGKPVVALSLKQGHSVVGIDVVEVAITTGSDHGFTFLRVDLTDYDATLEALRGCDAVIHLAALPNPGDYKVIVHNTNVVLSWNILRAAAELGIHRVAQASTVNVVPMSYSKGPQFAYFPIDETHPCLPDEPYGLSKLICEAQADSIVRRYTSMRIASLRLHWSVPDRSVPQQGDITRRSSGLWGYVQQDSAAEAFLLAATKGNPNWVTGHEAFFVTAPRIADEEDSNLLREKFWPDVPVREGKEFSGTKGFFDCDKAKELLGWVHTDSPM